MDAPRLRYASYHLHIASLLPHLQRANPSFQAQLALMRALDSALDLLESAPTFLHLTVAGGCAVLESYLRLRPEHLERLEAAVQGGQLHLNPFYALPEPAWHTPEGLIRNLLRGTASAAVFGGAMPVALCLGAAALPEWLPQVLRGFNLQAVLAESRPAQPLERLWQGDDGTHIPRATIHTLATPEALTKDLRDQIASACQSGHLLIACQWSEPMSAAAWRDRWSALVQRHRLDVVLHSTPTAFARAALINAALTPEHTPQVRSAQARPSPEALAKVERFLSDTFEPLIVFAALQGHAALPRQPQRLIAQLWQPIFDRTSEFLSTEAQKAAESALLGYLTDLQEQAARFAQEIGLRSATNLAQQLARVDEPRFRLSACKLPDDPMRSGVILRGRLESDQGAWIAIRPLRRFACCESISLAEAPSGGALAVAEDGTFRFYAEPRYLYTFWLHD
jgi:hypothetical protein